MVVRDLSKKYLSYLLISFVVIIIFSFCIDVKNCLDTTIFFIFQNRDIGRARELLSGNLIFYGPEMTGGGNLPGSLYYVFLAMSQAFSKSWISAWVMQYVLVLIAVVSGVFFFRSKSSPKIMLTWLILVSLTSFTYNYLRIFLNVSSMYVFAVLALIFIYQIYDLETEEKNRIRSLYWSCFSIGVGLHFHFSIICFFIALIFINTFSKKLDLYKFSFKNFLKGAAFLVLPCVPYIIWIMLSKMGIKVGVPTFYAGESVNAPISLMQLMTYGYDEKFLQVFLKVLLGVAPIPFFLLAPLMFVKNESSLNIKKISSRIKPFAVCSLVSFVLVLELCFSPQASRYTLPFSLSIVFLTLGMYEKIISSDYVLKKFNISAGIIQLIIWLYIYLMYPKAFYGIIGSTLLISSLFLVLLRIADTGFKFKQKAFIVSFILMSSLTFSQHRLLKLGAYALKDWSLFMPRYEDWRSIWGDINKATGWDYEKAKRRIYYIGHHLEQDPELVLDQSKNAKSSVVVNDQTPSGFFVSSRYRTYSKRRAQKIPTPREWLLLQNLQPELKMAIESGDIRLGKNISKEFLIIPYWVVNNKNVPDYFHNMGEGYYISEDDKKLSIVEGAEGAVKNSINEYVFKWNECADQNSFCSTGAIVTIEKKEGNNYEIDILVVGAALSQITPWVSPNWTQAWINPYAEVICDNGEKFKFPIASSIGFNRSISQDIKTPILQGNNSFVGPFKRRFEFNCDKGVKGLAIGRTSSKIETISKVKIIPGKNMSINI